MEYVELDDFLKDQEEAPLVAQGFIHGSSKGMLFGDAKKTLIQPCSMFVRVASIVFILFIQEYRS